MCRGRVHSWALRLPADVTALVDAFVPPRLGRCCDVCAANFLQARLCDDEEEWYMCGGGGTAALTLAHDVYCPLDYTFRVDLYKIVLRETHSAACIGRIRDRFWGGERSVEVSYHASEIDGECFVTFAELVEPDEWPVFVC